MEQVGEHSARMQSLTIVEPESTRIDRLLNCHLQYSIGRKHKKNYGDCYFIPTAIRFLKYSVGLIVSCLPIGYASFRLA